MALTQAAFADAIGVSPKRVSHLLKGQRPVTAELALRLGLALRQAGPAHLPGAVLPPAVPRGVPGRGQAGVGCGTVVAN